jgi:hypothetical protein
LKWTIVCFAWKNPPTELIESLNFALAERLCARPKTHWSENGIIADTKTKNPLAHAGGLLGSSSDYQRR